VRAVVLAAVALLVLAVPVAAYEDNVVVDSLGIAAPVVPARVYALPSGASTLTVPCWEAASAWTAGQNTVLFGHSFHPTCGGVFDRLHQAEVGQEIVEGGRRWVVTEVCPGTKPTDVHWLWPTQGPQLTLITCWPPHSTSGRLVVVARPATVSTARTARGFS
jgi:sortase (surface protein transpeptidase)